MHDKLFFSTMGNGPPLVLLHGWGFHSVVWKDIAEKLSKNFKIILIDLPGYGHNHHSIFADNIKTVVNQVLEVTPKEAVWLGWSLGGLIAQYIAINVPLRIKKLLTIASSPYFVEDINWPGMKSVTLTNFSQQLIQNYEKTLQNFLLLQFNDGLMNKSRIKCLKNSLYQYGSPSVSTLKNGLSILKNLDLRNEIEKISLPSLFMFGALDRITPASLAEKIRQKNSHIQVKIFLKAAHAPFLSSPDEFISTVEPFIHD